MSEDSALVEVISQMGNSRRDVKVIFREADSEWEDAPAIDVYQVSSPLLERT